VISRLEDAWLSRIGIDRKSPRCNSTGPGQTSVVTMMFTSAVITMAVDPNCLHDDQLMVSVSSGDEAAPSADDRHALTGGKSGEGSET
jgi:hypothetical protein